MKRLLIYAGLLLAGVLIWCIRGLSDEWKLKKDRELIATYQEEVDDLMNKLVRQGTPPHEIQEDNDSKDIFPKDNGFDAQDLGSGFFAYQVFGPLLNVAHVQQPERIPNKTPWKFGKGNSGIAANGSGFLITDAKNGDSDGARSTSGQAGFLEFEGSSISQSIELGSGKYIVVFDWEGRPNYPANKISVSIDDTILFMGTPADSSSFKTVHSKSVTIEKAGQHELVFRGLGGPEEFTGDTFIDNVKIRPVATDSDEIMSHPTTPPSAP